ncbi:MAG TPA: hypothetical protein VGM90_30535 [Kofleriaceae bacterium]
MRNLLFLAAVAGCSHPIASTTPTNSTAPTASLPMLVTDVPITPAADVCGGEIEDQQPGNVDRYGFDAGEGHWGYKDGAGTIVIAPTLRWGYEFKKTGIAAAIDLDGTLVFIDKTGKRLARAYAFDNGPDYFSEGFARIVGPDKKIGFISDRGVVPAGLAPQFDRAETFCHGKTQVVIGDKLYEIDRAGVKKELGPAPSPEDPCGAF